VVPRMHRHNRKEKKNGINNCRNNSSNNCSMNGFWNTTRHHGKHGNKESSKRNAALTAVTAAVLLLFVVLYLPVFSAIRIGFLQLTMVCMFLLFAGILIVSDDPMLDRCLENRFWIALGVFTFLVVNQIHFSSIGRWEQIFPQAVRPIESSVLFGTVRPIRSDEWLVNSPELIGQNLDLLQRFSFRQLADPSKWGFVLFGPAFGFSWHSSFLFVAMFLSSLEFALVLTKRNARLSLAFALFMAFSPGIQWWSGNVYVLYSQAALAALNRYLDLSPDRRKLKIPETLIDRRKLKIPETLSDPRKIMIPEIPSERHALKFLLAMVIAFSAVGFALSLYPAWQIPWFYLILLVSASIMVSRWKSIRFYRFDWLNLGLIVAIVAVSIGEYFLSTREAIALTAGTVYPGARFSTGGGENLLLSLNDLVNFRLPFQEVPAAMGNNSEASSFIGFTLLTILAVPFSMRKVSKQGVLFKVLAGYAFFMICWCVFPFPSLFAKISFLYAVQSERMVIPLTLVLSYLFLMMADAWQEKPSKKQLFVFLTAGVVGAGYWLGTKNTIAGEYLSSRWLLLLVAVMMFLTCATLFGWKRVVPLLLTSMVAAAGMTISPVSSGIGSMTERAINQEIETVKQTDPDAKWIGYGNLVYGQFLKSAGVSVINGVHHYPNFPLWNQLDPAGVYRDIYNRYAHIAMTFSGGPTTFVLEQNDFISINVQLSDLPKTKVKYVLSDEDLTALDTDEYRFVPISRTELNEHIYRFESISGVE